MTSLLIVLGPSFAKVRQGLTTMNWSEYNYARRCSHRLCDRWSSGGPAEETAEWMAESSDPKSQRRPPVATLFLRWSSAAPAPEFSWSSDGDCDGSCQRDACVFGGKAR